jgi:hypothetical protein
VSPWPSELEDAEEAGEIRAELERAGTPIGPYDILIAAQARRRSALLVTANTGEFTRVPGENRGLGHRLNGGWTGGITGIEFHCDGPWSSKPLEVERL